MASRKRIENLVAELLKEHKVVAPPIPVAQLARSLGLDVVMRDLEGDISGFLARTSPSSGLIGVNSHHPRVRQRFTIAHELGHYFMSPDEGLHIDHKFELKLRDGVSAEGIDAEEIEANSFAAELLMPSSILRADPDITETIDAADESALRSLAKKYQVSTQAMLIRLQQLPQGGSRIHARANGQD